MGKLNLNEFIEQTGKTSITDWVKNNWLGVNYEPISGDVKMTFTDFGNWPKWPGGALVTPKTKYQRQDNATYGPMQFTYYTYTSEDTDDGIVMSPSTDSSINVNARRVGWQYALAEHEKSAFDIEFTLDIYFDDAIPAGNNWNVGQATFACPESNLGTDGFRFGTATNTDGTYRRALYAWNGTAMELVYTYSVSANYGIPYRYCIRIDEVNNRWSLLNPHDKTQVFASGVFGSQCLCNWVNWYMSNRADVVNAGVHYAWSRCYITEVK